MYRMISIFVCFKQCNVSLKSTSQTTLNLFFKILLTCHQPQWSSYRGCGRWWTRWWPPAPRSPYSPASPRDCTMQRTPVHPYCTAANHCKNDPWQVSLSGLRNAFAGGRCGTHWFDTKISVSWILCSLVGCQMLMMGIVHLCPLSEHEGLGDLVYQQCHKYCLHELKDPPEK